jgi:hypothetical protein
VAHVSVEQLAAELHAILARLVQARETMSSAAALLDEAAQIAGSAVAGTAHPHVGEIPAHFDRAHREVARSGQVVERVEDGIRTYLASIGAASAPVSGRPHPPGSRSKRTIEPTGIANRHGDRYPEGAVPYSDDLPPRVRARLRNSPMTGHIEIGGRSYGTLTATTQDHWTRDAVQRVRLLGFSFAEMRLANHVEMKAVVIMIQNGATDGRVIINHSPCGSEPGAAGGCDSLLPHFIPAGSTLTVMGTDANGSSFLRSYTGKARR